MMLIIFVFDSEKVKIAVLEVKKDFTLEIN
jgi:hypothetical protein